jgi:hypothetical protein
MTRERSPDFDTGSDPPAALADESVIENKFLLLLALSSIEIRLPAGLLMIIRDIQGQYAINPSRSAG